MYKILIAIMVIVTFFVAGGSVRLLNLSSNSTFYGVLDLTIVTVLSLIIMDTIKMPIAIKNFSHPSKRLQQLFIFLYIYFGALIVLAGVLVNIYQTFGPSENTLNIVLVALSAGLFEELLCRGLLFDILLSIFENSKYRLTIGALGNSCLFGLLHLANVVTSHQKIEPTIHQIILAFSFGLVFSIIRIKTNGLWLVVCLHTLMDLQPGINSNVSTANSWLTLGILLAPIVIMSVAGLIGLDRQQVRLASSERLN